MLVAEDDLVARREGLDHAIKLARLVLGASLLGAERVEDLPLLLVAVLVVGGVFNVLVDGEGSDILRVVALVGAEGREEAARLAADALEGGLDLVDGEESGGVHSWMDVRFGL